MTFSIDQFRLDGKVAIVTGAGGRGNSIGRAYAMGLAAAGASVVVADINEEGAKAVAAEITAAGGKALGVRTDITDQASVAAMADATEKAFGGVDILVNNAALMVEIVATPAIQHTTEQWNRAFAVNVTGALNCSQAVVPLMAKRGGGKIINQVSGGAFPRARRPEHQCQRHRPRQHDVRCRRHADAPRLTFHQGTRSQHRHAHARRA